MLTEQRCASLNMSDLIWNRKLNLGGPVIIPEKEHMYLCASFFFSLKPAFQRQMTKEVDSPLIALVLYFPSAVLQRHAQVFLVVVVVIAAEVQAFLSLMVTSHFPGSYTSMTRCDGASCSQRYQVCSVPLKLCNSD